MSFKRLRSEEELPFFDEMYEIPIRPSTRRCRFIAEPGPSSGSPGTPPCIEPSTSWSSTTAHTIEQPRRLSPVTVDSTDPSRSWTPRTNVDIDQHQPSSKIQSSSIRPCASVKPNIQSDEAFKTVKKWIITNELCISLVSHRENLRIHLRRFEGNQPTMQGVTLSLETWAEFTQKFELLNVARTDSGFVANNELLVCVKSDGQVIFQNIFSYHRGNFGLKYTFLGLYEWEIDAISRELEMLKDELSEDNFLMLML